MQCIDFRNIESYAFLKEKGYHGNIVTDYSIYQFNPYAKQFWKNENVESDTAPLELNYKELKENGLENSELIIYGYYPMMVSAQCFVKTVKGCKKEKERISFSDRYKKTFTAKCNCDYCYNIIYNTTPLMLLDQTREIADLAPKALRLHFTIENEEQMKKILSLYENVFLKEISEDISSIEFTRGHFKRGIK